MSETRAAGPDGEGGAEGASKTPPRSLLVALVLGGIVLPGVVSYFLDTAGLRVVSDVIWVSGYAVTVFLAWYGWLRPLNITGPD